MTSIKRKRGNISHINQSNDQPDDLQEKKIKILPSSNKQSLLSQSLSDLEVTDISCSMPLVDIDQSSNQTIRQPIPKAVFESLVLPCLQLGDLLHLCASRVNSDWCKWGHAQLMYVVKTINLALFDPEADPSPGSAQRCGQCDDSDSDQDDDLDSTSDAESGSDEDSGRIAVESKSEPECQLQRIQDHEDDNKLQVEEIECCKQHRRLPYQTGSHLGVARRLFPRWCETEL